MTSSIQLLITIQYTWIAAMSNSRWPTIPKG
jgi:hypothetical protein